MNQDIYDDLRPWQRAIINKDALAICRSLPAYRAYESILDVTQDEAMQIDVDNAMNIIRAGVIDSLLGDEDFTNAITLDAESYNGTKGNSRV